MLAVLLMALDDHEEADNLTLLVRNYQDRLYNRAYKLLGNREDAEDAVQQVFLALVKNHSAPDINDPACPAILFTAVSNKARNILKIKMRTETEELDAGVGVAESGLAQEDIDLLKDAIGRLPEDLREAIHLIAEAGNVYIMGMRSSFALAHYLASRLGEMKQNVRFIQSSGMIYPEEIVGASERDICIAYVFPRYSKTAISVLSWMRSKGVRVILVTALGDTPVRRYADVCLGCATRSVSYKNSMTAPICLTNYLVAEYARQHYEEARETLTRTEEILSAGFYLGI